MSSVSSLKHAYPFHRSFSQDCSYHTQDQTQGESIMSLHRLLQTWISTTEINNSAQKGTLSQILKSSHDFRTRMITTDNISMGLAGTLDMPFSSESYAWQQTEHHSFSGDTTTFPMADIHWGSVSTRGVFRGWQVEPNGFGLVIDVKAGLIWALIAKPKITSGAGKHFADISTFMNQFDCYSGNLHLWDLEGIVLRAGNRL